MGNVRMYRVGKKHGEAGIRAMAHRQGKRYDSQGANESYFNGYREGAAIRQQKGKVGLDYAQRLNNQAFPVDP